MNEYFEPLSKNVLFVFQYFSKIGKIQLFESFCICIVIAGIVFKKINIKNVEKNYIICFAENI